MEFWTVMGLGTVFNALYQFGKARKKRENISKNDLFLETVALVLLVEAIDMLTIDWLYNYLGRIYYNLSLVYCLVFFSWYFMYYLCK